MARPARRRLLIVSCALVALVLAVGGVVALAADREDPETVTAAGATATTAAPAAGDARLSESTEAFMERWAAGPSTTMPLGEAGVPLHERPTTTTSTTTTIPRAFTRNAPVVAPSAGYDDRYTDDYEYDDEDRDPDWMPEEEPEPQPPTISPDDPRLRDAERRAQEFVDAMMRRDCDGFWSMLSARTVEFFESMESEDEEPGSAKDELCQSLREEEQIPVITVRPPARPYGKDGAMITLEAEGEPETEELGVVLENDRWMVDLFLAYDE